MNNKRLSLFAVLALIVAAGIGLRAQNPAGAYTSPAAGGGTPGGSNTHVQFNNAGAFGGDGNFTYAGNGGGVAIGGLNNTPVAFLSVSANGGGIGTTGQIRLSNGGGSGLVCWGNGGTTHACISGSTTNIVAISNGATAFNSPSYQTATNCSSSASPAVCGSAAAGMFVLPAAATSVTVNTTAVTANSEILVFNDDSLGTRLSVTCNTGIDNVLVSARVAATSFTITGSAPVTNPNCYSYLIIN